MAALISLAFFFNTFSLLTSFLAYALPYMIMVGGSQGFWGACFKGKCDWWFGDGFSPLRQAKDYRATDWFKASIGLYGIGLIFHIIAFIMALTHVICCRRKVSCSGTISGLLLFAFILVGIALVVYGVKMHDDLNIQFSTSGARFHAAFYLGIVSAAMTLLASLLYSCYSCV